MDENNINKKILLSHSFFMKFPSLFNNFSEIQSISKLIDFNEVSKFYYSYKSAIDKTLEKEDQIIEINNNKYDFKFYFYLTLLIEDNYDIVNYSYQYDLINYLDNEMRAKKELLRKVIESKIMLVLIYNFKGFNRSKQLKNDIDNIEKYNLENIKNNMHILREFDLNINEDEIDEISLEEIYAKIITYLVKNKKLEDYDYSFNIINQLELCVIDITEEMFDDLSSLLNSQEPFITDYSISNSDDLLDIRKINFYFILFKYLLKDSQKIYNIPLILNAKKIIIGQLKNSQNFNLDSFNNDIKERFEFNMKFILDSNYYYDIYVSRKNAQKIDIKIILEYYKNYFFESKKGQILEIENGRFNFKSNVEEINRAKIMNEKYCIIEYIFNYKNKGKEKTEEKIKSAVASWDKFEKMIRDKKLKKMRKDDKIMIGQFFKDVKNKDLLLKIFGEDCYENFKKEIDEYMNAESKRNIDINALKEILNYYQTFLFESKAEEIKIIEKATKNGGIDGNYELFLKDLEIAKKMNIRFPLINYLFNVQNEEGKMITELQVAEKVKRFETIEKMINDKKIKKMRKEEKNKIFSYFSDENNKSKLIEIFGSESYDFILKASSDNANKSKKKNLDNEIINKLEEVLKYYKQYMPESRKEEINSIEDIIKNNSDKYENYLKDYEIAKEMNLKTPLISLFGNLNNEEEINKTLKSWEVAEKMIKDKKIKKMRGDNKKKLINFFKSKNNKELLIKIFSEDNYKFFIEQNKIKVEEEDNMQNDNAPNNIEKAKEDINNDSENKNLNSNNESISKVQEKRINSSENENIKNANNNQSTNYSTKNNKNEKEIKVNEYSKATEEEIAEFILQKSKFKFHIEKNEEQISLNYEEIIAEINNNNILLDYEQLQRCKEYFPQNNIKNALSNSFLKFMEFKDDLEKGFKDKLMEVKNNFNLKMELEFLRVDNEEKNVVNNIECNYKLYSPGDNGGIQSFKDENILINKINTKSQGFMYLIEEIKNGNFQDIINKEEKSQKEIIIKNDSNNSTNSDEENQNQNKLGILSSENKVLEKNSLVGRHIKKIASCIMELSNKYFISISSDGSILVLNDKIELCDHFNEILKDFKNYIYSILEIKNNNIENDKEIHVIGCCNKELTMFHFNFEKETYKKENYEFPQMTCINCVQMEKSNFVVTGQNNSTYYTDLFFENNKEVFHIDILNKKAYRGIIKISDNIFALSSNKIIVDGEDKLIFFTIIRKVGDAKKSFQIKKSTEITGYSYIASTNGLCLVSVEKNKRQNKILLCGCKKYLQEQRNGIVLVNVLDKAKQDFISFYETGNFEVYCFCHILLDDEDGNKKINSDYILIGGFDVDKREGRIKLFKALYDENDIFTNIEYLQDIEFGFEGAVSSIIQSQKHGNILATCYNGEIYMFNKINLDFYLSCDI